MRWSTRLLFLACVLLGTLRLSAAQTTTEGATSPETTPTPAVSEKPAQTKEEVKAQQKTLEAIASLIDGIAQQRAEIKRLADDIESQEPTIDPEATAQALDDARQSLRKMQSNLEAVATGIPVEEYRDTGPQSFDLQNELVNLLQPLVDALKSATRDSRQIETLRQSLEQSNNRLRLAQEAVTNLRALNKSNEDPRLTEASERMLKSWEEEVSALSEEVQITAQALDAPRAAAGPFRRHGQV